MSSATNSMSSPEPGLPVPTPLSNGESQHEANEGTQMNSATPEVGWLFNRGQSKRRESPVRSASLRWNFSWTFVGNIIYSGANGECLWYWRR